MKPSAGAFTGTTYDSVVYELQRLKAQAGQPSYGAIAARMQASRARSDPSAFPPAKSTVYDAFRLGRHRLDRQLVEEIALALDASSDELAGLRRLYMSVGRSTHTESLPSQWPAPEITNRVRFLRFVLVVVAAVVVNVTAHAAVAWLGLPLYLDMIGTAAVAVTLGPWWAVLTGLSTNFAGAVVNTPAAIPFAAVNVVGALLWGYGARWGLSRSLTRWCQLNLVVALGCSMVAVPIIAVAFQGFTGHNADGLTHTLLSWGAPVEVAVSVSNLFTSVLDKIVTGFLALIAAKRIWAWTRRSTDPAHHLLTSMH